MDIQKALEWLTDVLSIQGRSLTVNDDRHTISEWDSLGDLMLLSRMDEELGIVVDADELAAMTSIKDILALMEKKNAFCAG